MCNDGCFLWIQVTECHVRRNAQMKSTRSCRDAGITSLRIDPNFQTFTGNCLYARRNSSRLERGLGAEPTSHPANPSSGPQTKYIKNAFPHLHYIWLYFRVRLVTQWLYELPMQSFFIHPSAKGPVSTKHCTVSSILYSSGVNRTTGPFRRVLSRCHGSSPMGSAFTSDSRLAHAKFKLFISNLHHQVLNCILNIEVNCFLKSTRNINCSIAFRLLTHSLRL